MTPLRSVFSRIEFIRDSLTQGISPHKLALTVVLGIIVGILPTVWGSSIVCAILAILFGLNLPAIQAANFLVYPLQIALFIPFHHLGARILPWGPSLSIETLLQGFRQDYTGNIVLILLATLKAVAAWLLTAPPLAVCLYLLFLAIFKRMATVKNGSNSLGEGIEVL